MVRTAQKSPRLANYFRWMWKWIAMFGQFIRRIIEILSAIQAIQSYTIHFVEMCISESVCWSAADEKHLAFGSFGRINSLDNNINGSANATLQNNNHTTILCIQFCYSVQHSCACSRLKANFYRFLHIASYSLSMCIEQCIFNWFHNQF